MGNLIIHKSNSTHKDLLSFITGFHFISIYESY